MLAENCSIPSILAVRGAVIAAEPTEAVVEPEVKAFAAPTTDAARIVVLVNI